MSDIITSADRYYRSNRRSALKHGGGDSTRKPGEPLLSNPTPVIANDDRHADKYYANPKRVTPGREIVLDAQGLPIQPVPPAKQGKTAPARQLPAKLQHTANLGRLELRRKEDAHTVAQAVASSVADGPVTVLAATSELRQRLQTILDAMTARQTITEEQRRDIRVYLPSPPPPAAAPTTPAPAPAPAPAAAPAVATAVPPFLQDDAGNPDDHDDWGAPAPVTPPVAVTPPATPVFLMEDDEGGTEALDASDTADEAATATPATAAVPASSRKQRRKKSKH